MARVVGSVLPALRPGPVDAHAHVFTRALGAVRESRYAPAEDADDARYLACLDAAGIGSALLVQPSFLGTDNRYMLDAVERAPDRFRAIAVVDAATDADALGRLRARGVVGIRLNMVGVTAPDLSKEPWAHLLRDLSAIGMFVEIQAEGEQWPGLLPRLVDSDLTLVLDHMGRPATASRTDRGFGAVLAAASRPNVWVKLSGPYRFPASARDAARRLLDRAGPSRLIWGSDWPWTQHPEIDDYPTTLSWLREWLGDPDICSQVADTNPRRLIASAI